PAHGSRGGVGGDERGPLLGVACLCRQPPDFGGERGLCPGFTHVSPAQKNDFFFQSASKPGPAAAMACRAGIASLIRTGGTFDSSSVRPREPALRNSRSVSAVAIRSAPAPM